LYCYASVSHLKELSKTKWQTTNKSTNGPCLELGIREDKTECLHAPFNYPKRRSGIAKLTARHTHHLFRKLNAEESEDGDQKEAAGEEQTLNHGAKGLGH
jgi:hypothetical protein